LHCHDERRKKKLGSRKTTQADGRDSTPAEKAKKKVDEREQKVVHQALGEKGGLKKKGKAGQGTILDVKHPARKKD